MEFKKLNACVKLLKKILVSVKNKDTEKILNKISKIELHLFWEILLNFIKGSFTLSISLVKKVTPFKKILFKVVNKEITKEEKINLLKSSQGKKLLGIIIPELYSLFTTFFSNHNA